MELEHVKKGLERVERSVVARVDVVGVPLGLWEGRGARELGGGLWRGLWTYYGVPHGVEYGGGVKGGGVVAASIGGHGAFVGELYEGAGGVGVGGLYAVYTRLGFRLGGVQ
ncbi:MAG: hypothetical protein ACK4SY_07235 [Pyrobaculum sp.]